MLAKSFGERDDEGESFTAASFSFDDDGVVFFDEGWDDLFLDVRGVRQVQNFGESELGLFGETLKICPRRREHVVTGGFHFGFELTTNVFKIDIEVFGGREDRARKASGPAGGVFGGGRADPTLGHSKTR